MSSDVPQKSFLTPFLIKTFQLVDDSDSNEVISWNEDGSSFIIWKATEFSTNLLPKFFKHNNFSSFIRQLNTYGFRKVVYDRWEFYHDCFRKGQISLLCDIQRRRLNNVSTSLALMPAVVKQPIANSLDKQINSQELSSKESDSLINSELINENDRLKRKNGDLNKENGNLNRKNWILNKELKNMKVLFNNVFNMMSKHTINTEEEKNRKEEVILPLDLLSSNEVGENSGATLIPMDDKVNPKLFGVKIGGKRTRVGNEKSSKCYDEVRLQLENTSSK
ncbi:heat stress transcription factor B-2a-like [Impatiens glandulifera]|uniref:heat stress transcription factor B-2a-like n=1 Tax=Impatiens glandulifera TaxID=253017 RepID=UPI001FB10673|nr:heat stress transcription factor B-2a-like [Impatiens glandulifera]